MTEKCLLKNIFDNMCASAQQAFLRDGRVDPYFFVFDQDFRVHVLVPDTDDKDRIARQLQMMMKFLKATAVVCVSEAWQRITTEEIKDLPENYFVRDDPGSVEVVIVTLTARNMRLERCWTIKKKGGTKILEEQDLGKDYESVDRFIGNYFKEVR